MKKNESELWGLISKLDTSLSITERFWQMLMVFFVGGGGLFTGMLAKADPVLKALGPIYWLLIALMTSVAIAFAINLVRSATLKKEMANYYSALSVPKSLINPLVDSFSDLVIPLEDLRVPGRQEHENKTFKRCNFVGPSTLAISGGNLNNVALNMCGDIVALKEGVYLTGVIFLKNCIIHDCQFFNITILADYNTARALMEKGLTVSGLPDE